MTRVDDVVAGTVGADGTGRLRFRTVGRSTYTIEQVSHDGTLTGATSVGPLAACALYKNGHLVARTVAQGGTISGDPPIVLRGQDLMELRYTGATPGAGIEMTVFYDDGTPG